jgi:hypothetical protein
MIVSSILRVLFGMIGLFVAGWAGFKTYETYDYLKDMTMPPAERALEQVRMNCQIILLAVGAALVLLAARWPRGHTYRLSVPFILGAIMLALFFQSYFAYMGQVKDPTLLTKGDTTPEMTATLAFLVLSVVCFKWTGKT